jgi:hypothetical protein
MQPSLQSIIEKAWSRAGGRCECTSNYHWHIGRCNGIIIKSFRGEKDNTYGWEAYNKNGSCTEPSDCEINCIKCYSARVNTREKAKESSGG